MSTEKVKDNAGVALVKSTWTKGARDFVSEIADMALDEEVSNEILKKIPVFGWLVKAVDLNSSIRERLFLKKVAEFLLGAADVSEEDKEKFKNNIHLEEGFAQKVGQNLMLLLERHESFEKSFLLGKAFALYIKNGIDYETFQRVSLVIDRAFIGDLNLLEEYYKKMDSYDITRDGSFSEFLRKDISQSLYNAGLVHSEGYAANIYVPNEIGKIVIALQKTSA